MRIWHNAGDYVSERGTVLAWMATILRYRAIDRLRRETARGGPPMPLDDASEPIDEASDPMQLLSLSVNATRLNSCLQGLRCEQRISIAAAFFDGCTHEQLSVQLKAPLGTVKSWVRRGLQLLRQCLEHESDSQRLHGAP